MTASPWPPALVGTPAVAVIERAIERGRLGHSLLLHGEDMDILAGVAHAIADRLLNQAGSISPYAPDKHPDCFVLRPAKKMRIISADATRELIGQVQVSAGVGSHKVAIIHEADRMNHHAANIFLKTLEEPPANTTLLLLTAHPHSLLPTIRSRCLHFRFPSKFEGNLPAGALAKEGASANQWPLWLQDYRSWLTRVSSGTTDKRAVPDHIFSIYGLVARFNVILDAATAEAWEKEKASLPPELDETEQIAAETGLANGLRLRFFAEIEAATRSFARPLLEAGDAQARRAFTAAIERLEHGASLFALNLNESAALEDFLLASLRLWTRRS